MYWIVCIYYCCVGLRSTSYLVEKLEKQLEQEQEELSRRLQKQKEEATMKLKQVRLLVAYP